MEDKKNLRDIIRANLNQFNRNLKKLRSFQKLNQSTT